MEAFNESEEVALTDNRRAAEGYFKGALKANLSI